MPKRSDHLGDPSLKSDQSAEDLLLEGLREHQEGRLSQAAQIYQSILDSTPDHFDALQLLGTIALQVKSTSKLQISSRERLVFVKIFHKPTTIWALPFKSWDSSIKPLSISQLQFDWLLIMRRPFTTEPLLGK